MDTYKHINTCSRDVNVAILVVTGAAKVSAQPPGGLMIQYRDEQRAAREMLKERGEKERRNREAREKEMEVCAKKPLHCVFVTR
eukprot:1348901-Amorphochlora_amoeboformis.AAC.1